jgi:hypothetical protein
MRKFKSVRQAILALVQLISQRVGRCLERQGLLEQDVENALLELEPTEDTDAMPHLLGSSVSYRIAVGPQQGRKAFMIRTIWPLDRPDPELERVAKSNGFSLHAGVSCEGHQKDKRERLRRYIARPAVAVPRLSLSSTGKALYTLKTPYRDSTAQYTGTSTTSRVTVSGLTNGVSYSCSVTATNALGSSTASTTSLPITPEEFIATGLPIWLLYEASK